MTVSVKLGSIVIDTYDGIKGLSAGGAPNTYNTFELPIGTDYQVPAGKIFTVGELHHVSTSAGGYIQLGYGDDGVSLSAVPPTNWVALTGFFYSKDALAQYVESIFNSIPAGKYPCLRVVGQISLAYILGIERE